MSNNNLIGLKQAQLRVLLVDDQPSTLLLLRAILEPAGCDVTECLTGRAAMSAFAARVFDLVVLDLNLPDLSGVELLQTPPFTLAKLPPVLGISASVTTEVLNKSKSAGMCRILQKPISRKQLIEAVSTVIGTGMGKGVFSSTPIFDTTVLAQVSDLGDELLHSFVHQALDDARLSIDGLIAANEVKDLNTWRFHALALSGVALTLGAQRLVGAVTDALTVTSSELVHKATDLTEQFSFLLNDLEHSLLKQSGLLSDRERSCLRLSAEGLTAKAIARRLEITARTVNFHLGNAAIKLGAQGRMQAVVQGLKLGAI